MKFTTFILSLALLAFTMLSDSATALNSGLRGPKGLFDCANRPKGTSILWSGRKHRVENTVELLKSLVLYHYKLLRCDTQEASVSLQTVEMMTMQMAMLLRTLDDEVSLQTLEMMTTQMTMLLRTLDDDDDYDANDDAKLFKCKGIC